ncbi:NAD(P)-binding protein [Massarina eburnea CBS 473.64]|uniref:NAD(P)-binding protein n=1 Tax=Massarina eburnea CBS 473.64 TaxID=1395130 RepID=A0A6A6S9X7_9PLEO|nr:NAD(P)-binding protein [Massarina eburnea CBS 473.64]
MAHNILVTGAAGYIGGSIIADFLTRNVIPKEHIHAAVRSEEQASALSTLNVNVVRLDLSNEEAILELLTSNSIDIIIHTASAIDTRVTLPLIKALGKLRTASGKPVYYIHVSLFNVSVIREGGKEKYLSTPIHPFQTNSPKKTSALSAFYPNNNWPTTITSDLDAIFPTEKSLTHPYPVRSTNIAVIETAKDQDVTIFIVVPPVVYGRGTGPYNKLSVLFPLFIKAAIDLKTVHQFAENITINNVHISDLTTLYALLVQSIVRGDKIASGEEGYYFGIAHNTDWHDIQSRIAGLLASRGLVTSSEVRLWPSDQYASDALGYPLAYLNALWKSGADLSVERPRSLGWKPEWDRERFLREIDSEIEDVVELGRAKSGMMVDMHRIAKK